MSNKNIEEVQKINNEDDTDEEIRGKSTKGLL